MPHIDLAISLMATTANDPQLIILIRCLLKHQALSIIIFDDIHWSSEMELAWEKIKKDKSVMLTIDLFFIGIVVFRPEFKVKQHFTIRF